MKLLRKIVPANVGSQTRFVSRIMTKERLLLRISPRYLSNSMGVYVMTKFLEKSLAEEVTELSKSTITSNFPTVIFPEYIDILN